MRTFLPRALSAVLLAATLPGAASAQRRAVALPPAPVPPSFSMEEAAIAGVGAASAALLLPLDRSVRGWSQREELTDAAVLKRLDAAFTPMGGPGPKYAAGAVFLLGLLAGRDELRDAGLLTGEALLGASLTKGILQRVVGRRRPGEAPHDPAGFAPGRGFEDRAWRSFPSGHATNAFALTAAVSEELRETWPEGAPAVTAALAAAATVTSLSRVFEDEHWLSDVVAGAALGVLVGSVVADANGR